MGCPAGLTGAPSPWQQLGSNWGLSQAPAPSPGEGSALLDGVHFPDSPCPEPGGDWRQLGERKWRQKVFKTQPSLEAGKGRGRAGGGGGCLWPGPESAKLSGLFSGSSSLDLSPLTVFQGFVGSGQVCLLCTFSQLGKSPGLEFRFIFCPRSVFQWGWCRGVPCPPERPFQNLVSALHGAPSGNLRGQ